MLGVMRSLGRILLVIGVAGLLAACSTTKATTSTVPPATTQASSASASAAPSVSISLSLPSGAFSSGTGPATATPTASPRDVRTVADAAGFATPSGRIVCIMADNSVRCDFIATDKAWTSPQPKGCQLAWGDSLQVEKTAGSTCHGDTLADTPALDSDFVGWRRASDPTVVVNGLTLAALPYGSAIVLGALECDSATTGVTCKNTATGHGFIMSREAYSIF